MALNEQNEIKIQRSQEKKRNLMYQQNNKLIFLDHPPSQMINGPPLIAEVGGAKILCKNFEGEADFQCTLNEGGGQNFSAQDFFNLLHSPPIDNDRSLRKC